MRSFRSIALRISTAFQQTCSFSTTLGSVTQLNGDRSVVKISGDNVINFLQVIHPPIFLSVHKSSPPSPFYDQTNHRHNKLFSTNIQGLLTNDITPLSFPSPTPIYTCLLNAQGRHLHDMFLYKHQSSSSSNNNNTTDNQPTTILADIDSLSLSDALRLLKRYRLRQKIDIDDVSDQYSVWVQYNDDSRIDDGDDKILFPPTEGWHADPRLAALGRRVILDKSVYSPTAHQNSKQQYQEWRYRHGVAEGSLEITPNQAISLEYNIDGLNGISFTKGCYIGQELMARTHYKGVVRKRVVPFKVVGSNDMNSTEEKVDWGGRYKDVVKVGSGEKVGKVVHVCGQHGLALLQLRKVMKEGLGGGEEGCLLNMVNLGDEGVQPVAIQAHRPEWWPESWGREEQ